MVRIVEFATFEQYSEVFREDALHRGLPQEYILGCLLYASKLWVQGLPIIYDTDHLADLLGSSPSSVANAAYGSRSFYRTFQIKKRSGGQRTIDEPLPFLKDIQYWILREILEKVKPHDVAKAYRKGYGISSGARLHRGQKLVLTVDVDSFFPSLRVAQATDVFKDMGYTLEVSLMLAQLCTLDGVLPQGAPTSGALANLILKPFDQELFEFCRNLKYRCSRYADDISVSGDVNVAKTIHSLRTMLWKNGLRLNNKKTKVMRQSGRQLVTGLVVNKKVKYPRSVYKELRKALHYCSKFGLAFHAAVQGRDAESYGRELTGKAASVLAVDPTCSSARRLISLLSGNFNY